MTSVMRRYDGGLTGSMMEDGLEAVPTRPVRERNWIDCSIELVVG